MRGLRPIPLRLLAEDAVVRVPDGDGGYAEGVAVSHVRFARTQSVVDDGHRSADAGRREDGRGDELRELAENMAQKPKKVGMVDEMSLETRRRAIAYGRARGNA